MMVEAKPHSRHVCRFGHPGVHTRTVPSFSNSGSDPKPCHFPPGRG
ncbi:MAG: hypothetical protein Q7R34_01490 [Dehalococcoidia bacterium]|nr:hypothetical protein [Dehalococcoidia bacterium]